MANADTPSTFIGIEVAYALPEAQTLLSLDVPVGTSLLQAVRLSGILQRFPEIDADTAVYGIFSKIEKAPAERVLKAGDRIEIYRPLLIDPKEARKARAAKAKARRAQG